MQKSGAGFAGFATWLDMTPAHPDLFVMPDPESVIPLPWKPEVAWVAGDPWMNGKPVAQAPRLVLKGLIDKAAKQRHRAEDGRRAEFHPHQCRRLGDLRSARYAGEALLRPGGHHAPLRGDRRNLLDHDRAGLGALSERP